MPGSLKQMVRILGAFGRVGAICIFLPFAIADAQDVVTFQPNCKTQAVAGELRGFTAKCQIGPVGNLHISRVTFHKDGSADPAAEASFLPFDLANQHAAVQFVIDRSDRKRARTIALGAADALRMIDATRGVGSYRFGIATMLGDKLDVIAPIGSSRDELGRSATAIRADGIGADDTHAVLDAISLLAQTAAERHILVLASDGKPEDRAFASDEIIGAARRAGVVVVGIGYREHTGEGVELASLKKLADETGGFYAEPLLPATRVEDAVISRFGQFVASGGVATFPLDRQDPRGRYQITVEIEGAKPLVGNYLPEITIPGLKSAEVKATKADPALGLKPAPGPKPAANTPVPVSLEMKPAIADIDQPEPGSLADITNQIKHFALGVFWAHPITIIGGAIVAIAVLVGSIIAMVRRAKRIRIFAWIELLDQRRTRFPVTTPGVRLGRHSDNDIRFRDKSVHRYHALLQRDAATGTYQINDVSRNQPQSNGVMVNGEFIHQPVALGNGDTVELGEVSFRFIYT